MTFLCCKENP